MNNVMMSPYAAQMQSGASAPQNSMYFPSSANAAPSLSTPQYAPQSQFSLPEGSNSNSLYFPASTGAMSASYMGGTNATYNGEMSPQETAETQAMPTTQNVTAPNSMWQSVKTAAAPMIQGIQQVGQNMAQGAGQAFNAIGSNMANHPYMTAAAIGGMAIGAAVCPYAGAAVGMGAMMSNMQAPRS